MSRAALVKIAFGLFLLVAFFLLWTLAYELTVAARWKATIPGDGSGRFDLLKAQNAARDWRGLFLGWDHFTARLAYPRTQAETIIRGLIAAGAVLGLGAAAFIARYALRKPMPYGDAKFGTVMDAERKELLGKNGLVLGRLNGALLHSDDPSHVLVVGPTRSGKGVSFVIPNGYSWQGSSVWFDPKRENFDAFGAYRQSIGDRVFVFSPGERCSHRYNPLDFIRRDERMPTDCNVVASFIVPEGVGSSEIWARAARQLLSAMIGYVVSSTTYENRRHMRSVTLLTSTGQDFRKVLKTIVDSEGQTLPTWIVQGLNQFIALEPETRNSALFNVSAALNPWTSDLIAAVTAESDFDIRELRRTPMAIFIGCSVAQLDVYRPIIKILVQQIHDLMMAAMPADDEPHKVLVMIDEFRQLGRMDALVSKLTINLGYNFRMVLILQDVGQLDEVYGKPVRVTTLSACQVKLFIRINDLETSEYVSEMLGSTTMEIRTPIIRANQGVFSARDKSVSYQERPLRTPEELRLMSPDKAILLVPNCPGFVLTKTLYYKDAAFRSIYKSFFKKRLKAPELARWSDAKPDEPSPPAAIAPATIIEAQPMTELPPPSSPSGPGPAPIASNDAASPETGEQAARRRRGYEAEATGTPAPKPEICENTPAPIAPEVEDDGAPLVAAGADDDNPPLTPIAGDDENEKLSPISASESAAKPATAPTLLKGKASAMAAVQKALAEQRAAQAKDSAAVAPDHPKVLDVVQAMQQFGWAAE